MRRILECVTNFSCGRDEAVIEQICHSIESVDGVKVLNYDPGYATNRTVVTFAGEAEALCQAAFQGVKTAAQLIDMREHHGEHPRLGATDVLPLIPLEGVSMEECAQLARELAQRISQELLIPTYCYEHAAFREERRNLARCRMGEYEALPQRVTSDDAPDFGAREFDEVIARSGATNVGARDFLVAVNFNLDTKDSSIADAIAKDVRESSHRATSLKCCKAIGWFIEEYDKAQVSTNLTNISTTPLHIAFEAISLLALKHGTRVTGTEIIALVPKRVLLDAGRHFADDGEKSLSEQALVDIAVERMNLSELKPYHPKQRVIEYLMEK